jgi:hypothetical protein
MQPPAQGRYEQQDEYMTGSFPNQGLPKWQIVAFSGAIGEYRVSIVDAGDGEQYREEQHLPREYLAFGRCG